MNDNYLNKFKPLQVVIRHPGETEQAIKAFKNMVNKERILAEYKDRQSYEKPSIKKRRKAREARDKRLAYEYKMRLIASGEWGKRQKKKEDRKEGYQNGQG